MILKKISFNSRSKNLMTLMSGTGLAQIIPILSVPILSRIYSPTAFGNYSGFLAISALITILSTQRFEWAMLSEKGSNYRDDINKLIVTLIIMFGAAFLVIGTFISYIFSSCSLSIVCLLLLSLIVHATYKLAYYNCLLDKKYKLISIAKIAIPTISVLASITIGIYVTDSANGLIFSVILGYFIASLLLIRSIIYNWPKSYSFRETYSSFLSYPMYDLPSAFTIQISNRILILTSTYFSMPEYAGLLAMSQRLFDTPSAVISSAYSDVFRQESVHLAKDHEGLRRLFKSTRNHLSIIGLIPVLLVYLFSGKVIPVVLGQEWTGVVLILKTLMPFFYIRFVVGILSNVLYLKSKLQENLKLNVIRLFLSSLVLFVFFGSSPQLSLVLYSCVQVIIFGAYYIYSYRLIK